MDKTKINNIRKEINEIEINIYTNIEGSQNKPIPFTRSLFTEYPIKTKGLSLGNYPLFTTKYKYPYEILKNKPIEKVINILFNKNEFLQTLIKDKSLENDNTDIFTFDDKINRIEENVKSLLKLLFPTYYPVIENHTDTYGELIEKKISKITDISSPLLSISSFLKSIVPFIPETQETTTKDTSEDTNEFTYLNIGGKIYTVLKVVYLNDFINNPKYNSILTQYTNIIDTKEINYKKIEWDIYNIKKDIINIEKIIEIELNIPKNMCEFFKELKNQYITIESIKKYRTSSSSHQILNNHIETIYEYFNKYIFKIGDVETEKWIDKLIEKNMTKHSNEQYENNIMEIEYILCDTYNIQLISDFIIKYNNYKNDNLLRVLINLDDNGKEKYNILISDKLNMININLKKIIKEINILNGIIKDKNKEEFINNKILLIIKNINDSINEITDFISEINKKSINYDNIKFIFDEVKKKLNINYDSPSNINNLDIIFCNFLIFKLKKSLKNYNNINKNIKSIIDNIELTYINEKKDIINSIYKNIIRNIELSTNDESVYNYYKSNVDNRYNYIISFLNTINIVINDTQYPLRLPIKITNLLKKIFSLIKNMDLLTNIKNFYFNDESNISDIQITPEISSYYEQNYPELNKFKNIIKTFVYPNRESSNTKISNYMIQFIDEGNKMDLFDFLKDINYDNIKIKKNLISGLDLYYTNITEKPKYEIQVYMDLVEGKLTKDVLLKTGCYFKDNELVNLYYKLIYKGKYKNDYIFDSKLPVLKIPDLSFVGKPSTIKPSVKTGGKKLKNITRKYRLIKKYRVSRRRK